MFNEKAKAEVWDSLDSTVCWRNAWEPVSVEQQWQPVPEEVSHSIQICINKVSLYFSGEKTSFSTSSALQEHPTLIKQYFCILWEKSDKFIILLRLNLKWHCHRASCSKFNYLSKIHTMYLNYTHLRETSSWSNIKPHLQSM